MSRTFKELYMLEAINWIQVQFNLEQAKIVGTRKYMSV
jgi:hypothetical protein